MLLVFISSNAVSANETYLCVAERGAAVSKSETGRLDSHASAEENRYLVSSEAGVRRLSDDVSVLSDCSVNDEGRLTSCQFPGKGWGGFFSLGADNTFVMMATSLVPDDAGFQYYSLIGSCSSV
ncbi:MAG: hypothetical protein AAGI44_06400 [Pseudomonadota bacterium]